MSPIKSGIFKIRSIALDTNVISDIPALNYYETRLQKGVFLPADEQEYYQRCRASKKAIFVMLDFDVKPIGLPIVRKELAKAPVASQTLISLYRGIFKEEIASCKEVNRLAEKYVEKIGLQPADAMVVAFASKAHTDILLSWNRHHIVKDATLKAIGEINHSLGVHAPEIMTPETFLERILRTEKKSIALSPIPLREIYRVQSYLSKRGI